MKTIREHHELEQLEASLESERRKLAEVHRRITRMDRILRLLQYALIFALMLIAAWPSLVRVYRRLM